MADDALAEAGTDLSGVTDWQEAADRAAAAGSPLSGLPRGLRVRRRNEAAEASGGAGRSEEGDGGGLAGIGQHLPSRREVGLLAVFLAAVLVYLWLKLARPTAAVVETPRCKQCQQGWWDHFWQWRLEEGSRQAPPEGMEWEWSLEANRTDWFGVSEELVDRIVATYADPALGPVLHVGCGDSPLPELLYKAGYKVSEHIDIAPQVVASMRGRYPAEAWPGMSFAVRDFLAPDEHGGGPPPPLHRFAAVIDKAGIWDWLQDEASEHLPRLLESVRSALLIGPQRSGVYIIVTKQTPVQLSDTLAAVRTQFYVEVSQPLGGKGIAWSYVLVPI